VSGGGNQLKPKICIPMLGMQSRTRIIAKVSKHDICGDRQFDQQIQGHTLAH
jgi:hypothetical protein